MKNTPQPELNADHVRMFIAQLRLGSPVDLPDNALGKECETLTRTFMDALAQQIAGYESLSRDELQAAIEEARYKAFTTFTFDNAPTFMVDDKVTEMQEHFSSSRFLEFLKTQPGIIEKKDDQQLFHSFNYIHEYDSLLNAYRATGASLMPKDIEAANVTAKVFHTDLLEDIAHSIYKDLAYQQSPPVVPARPVHETPTTLVSELHHSTLGKAVFTHEGMQPLIKAYEHWAHSKTARSMYEKKVHDLEGAYFKKIANYVNQVTSLQDNELKTYREDLRDDMQRKVLGTKSNGDIQASMSNIRIIVHKSSYGKFLSSKGLLSEEGGDDLGQYGVMKDHLDAEFTALMEHRHPGNGTALAQQEIALYEKLDAAQTLETASLFAGQIFYNFQRSISKPRIDPGPGRYN